MYTQACNRVIPLNLLTPHQCAQLSKRTISLHYLEMFRQPRSYSMRVGYNAASNSTCIFPAKSSVDHSHDIDQWTNNTCRPVWIKSAITSRIVCRMALFYPEKWNLWSTCYTYWARSGTLYGPLIYPIFVRHAFIAIINIQRNTREREICFLKIHAYNNLEKCNCNTLTMLHKMNSE